MKTWVITGSNQGLGLELCRQVIGRGDAVIAACRQSSTSLQQLGEGHTRLEIVDGVEVTRDEAVAKLVTACHTKPIDVLVANAAILTHESLDDFDLDRMRHQFEVNTLGTLRVVAGLLPQLRSGSTIALLSSRAGCIGDNGSGGLYGYRMSKAALNMAGVSLARDLKSRRIAVAILHPGFVRTHMTGYEGYVDPPEATAGLIARIDNFSLEQSGTFWHANGEPLPW